jgi:D-beta-D-heptose 7-phosphate kinase / D-beta-D-heptose 1-phosphate adenosyltransferase
VTLFQDPIHVLETVRTGFHGLRAVVVGDLVLDRYLWGRVERISPEAPVPVVRLEHKTHAAGGAANVAANLSALGTRVAVAGVLGADEDGRHLRELLRASGIDTQAILQAADRPTVCKTRVLGGQQQMLRFDVEKVAELDPDLKSRLLCEIEQRAADSSLMILSDYGKGLLDVLTCRSIVERARALSIPVFVDPKGLNYEKYRGCSLISPNRMELAAAASVDTENLELLFRAGQRLRSDLEIRYLVVTLGELGMALLDESGIHRFPAVAREVFDVSGAGDTAIATIAAAVAAGLHLHDAIRLANLAAGIVIRKVGTVPVSREELLASLASDEEATEKLCTSDALLQRVARWRAAGRRIVFTNGCFDLFHAGHLALLEQAKRLGDCLVVALNTDRSVRTIKGAGRPILSEDSRAKLVVALPCVDAVILFDEETPLNLIGAVRPDVLVKGGDYAEDEVVGASEMKNWGGKVALIPLVEGFSTLAILKRMVSSPREGSHDLVQ